MDYQPILVQRQRRHLWTVLCRAHPDRTDQPAPPRAEGHVPGMRRLCKRLSPLQWAPEYEDYLFEQWERGTFDDYWRQPELYAAGHYEAFGDVAVMLLCGWWDPYAQTTTDNYLGLSARTRGHAHMVLGPWT